MNIVRQITKDILKYKTSGSVLDLGAGAGAQTFFLAEHGFVVTAVEKEKKKIEIMRDVAHERSLAANVIQADIGDFTTTEQYDVVLAAMSLHFLQAQQIPGMIVRMKSWTAPGGLNVISAYTNENPSGLRPYLFEKGELSQLYSDWEILEHQEYLGKKVENPQDGGPERRYIASIIARKSTQT